MQVVSLAADAACIASVPLRRVPAGNLDMVGHNQPVCDPEHSMSELFCFQSTGIL